MVSLASIFGMITSLIIVLALPIGGFFLLRKRMQLHGVPLVAGVVVFIVFALILESLMHQAVLSPAADGTNRLLPAHPWLYVLYGTMAAGVFEETGRFVAFHVLKKRFQGVRTAISYGIGHGGTEAVLLVGASMVANLVFAALINSGRAVPGPASVVDALTTTQPFMFYMAGVERIMAIALQLSFSVIVWVAVARKRWWLFPVAIAMHAAADVPAAMYQAGKVGYELVFGVLIATVVLYAVFAVYLVRQALTDENAAAVAAAEAAAAAEVADAVAAAEAGAVAGDSGAEVSAQDDLQFDPPDPSQRAT